jgi:hypothetical protein
MAKELESKCLSKDELQVFLLSKWGFDPDILYRNGSNIILHADAALQLKEKCMNQ